MSSVVSIFFKKRVDCRIKSGNDVKGSEKGSAMFEISWTELLVILVLCIVVLKPKDLPDAMRALGRAAAWLKRTAADLQEQFHAAMREADMEDVGKAIEDMRDLRSLSPTRQIRSAVERIGEEPTKAIDILPSSSQNQEKP